MKCILGKKIGMTQVFLPGGEVIPVTRIKAGPCQITQVKENSIQIGFDEVKEFRLKKPELGHLKDLRPTRVLKEMAMEKTVGFKRGDEIALDTFVVGDKVDVIGTSKGRGFAGVVKRHHFAGGPASHGHKDNLRAPGSIGAGGVQRVFKGMRMAGHMGDERVTIKNLEIVAVDLASNELLIKGAVPGGRRALVIVVAPGELKIKSEIKEEEKTAVAEKAATETTVVETPIAEETKAVDTETSAEAKDATTEPVADNS